MPGDIKTKDIELQPMGDSADAAQVTLDPAVLQATLAEMQVRIAAQLTPALPLIDVLFDPQNNCTIDFGAQLMLPMHFHERRVDPIVMRALTETKIFDHCPPVDLSQFVLPEHFHERRVDPIVMRALTEIGIFDRHPTVDLSVDLSQFLTNPNGARAEACDVPRGWQPSTPGAGGDPS